MLCATISNADDYNNELSTSISWNWSWRSFSKNEYAEVVRVRQLIDEVVEAYSQAIQVCSLHWLSQFWRLPLSQNSSFTYDALAQIWLVYRNFAKFWLYWSNPFRCQNGIVSLTWATGTSGFWPTLGSGWTDCTKVLLALYKLLKGISWC